MARPPSILQGDSITDAIKPETMPAVGQAPAAAAAPVQAPQAAQVAQAAGGDTMSMMQPDTPENRKLAEAAKRAGLTIPGVDQMVSEAGAPSTAADPDLAPVLKSIGDEYKALLPHVPNMSAAWGKQAPDETRKLEFYHPWQDDNPSPGKLTSEVFDRSLKGDILRDSIAGDSLHYLGTKNPDTGKPIDPTYRAMKDKLIGSLTADQKKTDREAYDMDIAEYGPRGLMDDPRTGKPVTFETWFDENRADAYMRGGIFPKNNPGWDEYLTSQQKKILSDARGYLTKGNAGDEKPGAIEATSKPAAGVFRLTPEIIQRVLSDPKIQERLREIAKPPAGDDSLERLQQAQRGAGALDKKN